MKHYSLILTALFLLISCNKVNLSEEVLQTIEVAEGEIEVATEPKEAGTIKLVEITSNINSSTANNSFDFTDENNLFLNNSNAELSSWKITATNSLQIDISLEGKKITKLKFTSTEKETQATNIMETVVEYDGSTIHHIASTYEGEVYQKYDLVYTDQTILFKDVLGTRDRTIVVNSDGSISRFSQEGISIQFEYVNENLTKKILNDTSIFEYAYDDKRNPLKTLESLNLATILNYLNIIAGWEFLITDEHNLWKNTNNLTKFTVENYTLGNLEDQTFSYEYDAEDFPIQKMNTANSILTKYSYSLD
ncbi:hypothetical protein NQT66_16625 [Cellulophaga baltica]|uniref:hypothetical protein n=1 Tax=Cellulophaga baltica TaxID=76594 RepID=UPI0021473B9D|nr:hypothetical protein [Cellulophaga baltica]MCR1026448.1 hypothetical protein [Cellulophaga baltica]